jgi:hypothetical protein
MAFRLHAVPRSDGLECYNTVVDLLNTDSEPLSTSKVAERESPGRLARTRGAPN